MEIFVAYCHHIGTYPGHPRLLQTCEMEFYKNSKVFNYCQQEVHLRRCSSSRSASRVTAIVIMHPIVEKWSFEWSVTSYAARKKNFYFDEVKWLSPKQPLQVKVHFTPLKQKTNLSSKTVKWELVLWFTRAPKSEYRLCKSFTVFH